MSRICTLAAFACGLVALTLAAPTGAQAQSSISPYFMVIVDRERDQLLRRDPASNE